MARNIKRIAKTMNARIVGRVPRTGGGAFGAARLVHAVNALRAKLKPGQGRRPGRPTNSQWVLSPKVPMSPATKTKLEQLAERVSSPERRISPMQLAAQLLEDEIDRQFPS